MKKPIVYALGVGLLCMITYIIVTGGFVRSNQAIGGYQPILRKSSDGVWEKLEEKTTEPLMQEENAEQNDLLYRGEIWEMHDLIDRGEEVAVCYIVED